MGQKTNPTALRLEKTNQHYNSCWYSDRFYAQQLHNNYKTSNYISKIFYKIKKVPYFRAGRSQQQIIRTKPLIYAKAGHGVNQIFCIFPKFRNKYYWRRGNRKTKDIIPRLHRSLNQRFISCLSMLCTLTAHRRKIKSPSLVSAAPTISRVTKDLRQGMQSTQTKNQARVRTGLEQTYLKPLEDLSPLVRALFQKHSWDCQAGLEREVYVKQENTFFPKLNRHKVRNHYLARLEQVMETKYQLGFARKQSPDPSLSSHNPDGANQQNAAPSVDSFQAGFQRKLAAAYRVFPSSTRLANLNRKLNHSPPSTIEDAYRGRHVEQTNPSALRAAKKTNLYLLKASFAQQNSQFLAQRISNGLRNRFTFPRLRRQILWDIKKSKYIKGIRVTLSGRVESKSKKAQKARSRTFQWGQTELHVLSSLVQFTSQDLITPRGKIGIKVWICYGR